jgi:hypothetical protein
VAQKINRKAIRRKIGETAWIRPEGGFAVRPCRLIDYSETGAKIALPPSERLSSTFYLLISRNASPGRRARIKWRKGDEIGVEFF